MRPASASPLPRIPYLSESRHFPHALHRNLQSTMHPNGTAFPLPLLSACMICYLKMLDKSEFPPKPITQYLASLRLFHLHLREICRNAAAAAAVIVGFR